MDTKLDARQGQFPANFPETFKDFFTVMSEDEDHLELFSSLLEDKVIPRGNKFTQRRCGGSLRCTSNSGRAAQCDSGGLGAGRHGDVTRSNSFRMNRPRNPLSNSQSSEFDAFGATFALGATAMRCGGGNRKERAISTENNGMLCKQLQYCCLHPTTQATMQSQNPKENPGVSPAQQALYWAPQADVFRVMASERAEPEGEDNCTHGKAKTMNGPMTTASNIKVSSSFQQHRGGSERRHSIILERSLDLDASNDESDTISSTSTKLTTHHGTAAPYPQYHMLKPILKQPQQQQQQNEQQTNPLLKDVTSHRLLPQPPVGRGVHHTKQEAMHRIQQQSGLFGSKTNLSSGGLRAVAATDALVGSMSGECVENGTCIGEVGVCKNQSGSGVDNYNAISDVSLLANDNKAIDSSRGQSNATTLMAGNRHNFGSIRNKKSPILMRRRSSSIVASLIAADKSFNVSVPTATDIDSTTGHIQGQALAMAAANSAENVMRCGGASELRPVCDTTEGDADAGNTTPTLPFVRDLIAAKEQKRSSNDRTDSSDDENSPTRRHFAHGFGYRIASTTNVGTGSLPMSSNAVTSSTGISASKQRQRMRTSSMPAESRKPRLADTRRSAIHCADIDLDYYRLRSFSITSHGVCNLGDSVRSRRSRSINSVTSTTTSNSGKDRHNSNASRTSGDLILVPGAKRDGSKDGIQAYKIAMLGTSGVGKTTLTYQFTTSDYISAYDLSLDDDYGQKTVSVLVDGIETDLEIIDHPACEMSTEAFCSTYNIDLFVVVYSVADRSSFKGAEKMLKYLKDNEMLLSRGAILVGNKTDLERHREVNRQMGRKFAKEIACKFIETSAGLGHNVDELLVGCVAQVKLNVQRLRNLCERDRQRLNLQSTIQKHRCMHLATRRMVRQLSMCQADDSGPDDPELEEGRERKLLDSTVDGMSGSERTASTSLSSNTYAAAPVTKAQGPGPVRKVNRRTINLESILKMGESELDDDDEQAQRAAAHAAPLTKFEILSNRNREASSKRLFDGFTAKPNTRQLVDHSVSSLYRNTDKNVTVAGAQVEANDPPIDVSSHKAVSRFTNRTKVFLSSVLKFKKTINVKRRNSSSCSDLFVI